MAHLLYRLGLLAARRKLTVLTAWLALIALAAGGYALFGGTIASAISIPGTETSRVVANLGTRLPGAAGGSGDVVFKSTSGNPFTAAQRAAVKQLMAKVAKLPGVHGAQDPFALQTQLDAQRAKVRDGQNALAAGRAKISAAEKQLATAPTQLAAAQKQLDAQRTQAGVAATLPPLAQQFATAQAKIDAQKNALPTERAKLTAAAEKLDASQQQLTTGKRLIALFASTRFVSTKGDIALGVVQFRQAASEVSNTTKTSIVSALAAANIAGVAIYPADELAQQVPGLVGPGEIIGLLVAVGILVLLLRTLLGTVLPLAGAIVGVSVAVLGSLSFSSAVEFISVTPVLGVMLGLAVGIDYSLFILNRHRRQLREGMALRESIGLANGTSGTAVVFAGTTVVVALLALNVTGIPFLGLMGTVGAAAVAIAILVAISLTPALLALVGERVLRRAERAHIADRHGARPVKPERPMSTVRAIATVVVGVAVLGAIALPATQLRLGLPTGQASATDSSQYLAYKLGAQAFGAGQNGPLLVVADLRSAPSAGALPQQQVEIGEGLRSQAHVAAVIPLGTSTDRRTLAFEVVPTSGPNSVATQQLVTHLRAISPLTTASNTAKLGVAGNASANIDVSAKLAAALAPYLALVVGLSLLILIVVFRSFLVPLSATAGFVLSLLAAFGGLTAIFQFGWGGALFGVHDPEPIVSFLPIIEMGVLFGLAMDYQLFLVSGMREAYVHGVPARVAVQRGVHAGRAVVIAAALIMTSVFAGFAFANDPIIRPIGFGLGFGVLVDAFAVRLLLIPATMYLLGKAAWWFPKWLDRLVPNVDVEGAALEREHPVASPEVAADKPTSQATPAADDWAEQLLRGSGL